MATKSLGVTLEWAAITLSLAAVLLSGLSWWEMTRQTDLLKNQQIMQLQTVWVPEVHDLRVDFLNQSPGVTIQDMSALFPAHIDRSTWAMEGTHGIDLDYLSDALVAIYMKRALHGAEAAMYVGYDLPVAVYSQYTVSGQLQEDFSIYAFDLFFDLSAVDCKPHFQITRPRFVRHAASESEARAALDDPAWEVRGHFVAPAPARNTSCDWAKFS